MILPAYFYNTRTFCRIMKNWSRRKRVVEKPADDENIPTQERNDEKKDAIQGFFKEEKQDGEIDPQEIDIDEVLMTH